MSNDIAGVAVVPGERREHDIGERAVPLAHGRSHDLKAHGSPIDDRLRTRAVTNPAAVGRVVRSGRPGRAWWACRVTRCHSS
jgi:hypothetical protein